MCKSVMFDPTVTNTPPTQAGIRRSGWAEPIFGAVPNCFVRVTDQMDFDKVRDVSMTQNCCLRCVGLDIADLKIIGSDPSSLPTISVTS